MNNLASHCLKIITHHTEPSCFIITVPEIWDKVGCDDRGQRKEFVEKLSVTPDCHLSRSDQQNQSGMIHVILKWFIKVWKLQNVHIWPQATWSQGVWTAEKQSSPFSSDVSDSGEPESAVAPYPGGSWSTDFSCSLHLLNHIHTVELDVLRSLLWVTLFGFFPLHYFFFANKLLVQNLKSPEKRSAAPSFSTTVVVSYWLLITTPQNSTSEA